MFALIANLNPLAARADEVFQRRIEIDGMAHLVKVRDLKIGPLPDAALVGLEFAQNEFQQGGFARTIRTDQADFVAAQNSASKALDNLFGAKCLAHISELCNDLALISVA